MPTPPPRAPTTNTCSRPAPPCCDIDGLVEQRGHPIDDGLALAAGTAAQHATSLLADVCDPT